MAGDKKDSTPPRSLAERLRQTAEKRDRESVIVPPPGDAANLAPTPEPEPVPTPEPAPDQEPTAQVEQPLDLATARKRSRSKRSRGTSKQNEPAALLEAPSVAEETPKASEDTKASKASEAPLKPETPAKPDVIAEPEEAVAEPAPAATEPLPDFTVASFDEDEPPNTINVSYRRGRRPVTRTYEGARRSMLAVLLFPVFALFIVAEALREVSYRVRRDKAQAQRRSGGPFTRPQGMPTTGTDRSVADVVEHLRKFPHDPTPMPTSIAFFREYGAEGLNVLFSHRPELTTLAHQYPGVFKQRLFTGYDGVQLAGLQAMHDQPRPALIVCHGFATNKNFDYVRRLAKRAFTEWGFHVATFDMRGWGQSSWTTDAPSSVGWHEAQDVVEIARELQQDPRVSSVGVIGFSLGGLTVLNAARESSAADDCPIDGGVFAVSAPTEMRTAINYISTQPPIRSPFFGLWAMWQATLRNAARREGLDSHVNTWRGILEATSLVHYDTTYEVMVDRPSPLEWADQIRVPTLALHARDDFVVGMEHAEALAEVSADNDNVHVWLTDVGNHCAFSTVDPRWFYSVVRRWFEYWAEEPGSKPVAS